MNGPAAILRRHRKDVTEYLRLFGKTAVALLVVIHMAAVVAFSLPSFVRDGFVARARDAVRTRTRPYMLLASQWQEWNLFAPDPLRRVTSFSVEAEDGLRWRTQATFGVGSFPWWRHATYAKLLPALLDGGRLDRDVFRERFLQILCRDLGLADGTMVRLRENASIIPYVERHEPKEWWRSAEPRVESNVTRTTPCGIIP